MSTMKAPKKRTTKAKPTAAGKRTKSASKEKRVSGNRIPIQLLVDYKCDGHYLFDFCKDLGSGGVFIETQKPQNQGTKLDLTFTIPDSKETLTTTGTVIWSQPPVKGRDDLVPGMGVQFDEFQKEQRSILEDFVQRYTDSNTDSDKSAAS